MNHNTKAILICCLQSKSKKPYKQNISIYFFVFYYDLSLDLLF